MQGFLHLCVGSGGIAGEVVEVVGHESALECILIALKYSEVGAE